MNQEPIEELVRVADANLHLLKGGSGPPLLVFHGTSGNPGWPSYHRALADYFTVYAPSHPGFGKSEQLPWIASITDMAHYYLGLVDELELGRVSLMGFSMGGWIVAEMAAMCAHNLNRLVLVDAEGIRPHKGEIAELFNVAGSEVLKLSFYDSSQVPDYKELFERELTDEEQAEKRQNQEMATRLCWKPYMHNPQLPAYLKRVRTPTLIIWGRQDKIAPLSCAELYHEALANSSLHIIDNCGHAPQLEKPQEFLEAVVPFLRGA